MPDAASRSPRLSIVIPCFNEEHRLGRTLDDLFAWSRPRGAAVEVVVVDDASTDGTAALVTARAAAAPELRLVRLPRNAGKGGSVRAGMEAARGARRAFADADGAVPFADMERLEAALDAGADVAVGSRVLDPSLVDALFHRRFFGFFFRTLVRWLLVRSVADTQCGFKLFTAEAAARLFQDQLLPGFAFDVELLGRAERLGLRIAEVPVRWRDQPGSKVRVIRDGLVMARDVIRLRRRLGPPRRA
jgi:dolichyl-phosphate beta-glucosyltransferase